MVYKEALRKLMADCPNYATLRTYLYIATAQDYDTVTFITTSYIAAETGMRYQTVWNAVKWLINNAYIKRASVGGSSGFIVNPLISTCGRKNYDNKLKAFTEGIADLFGVNESDVTVDKVALPD